MRVATAVLCAAKQWKKLLRFTYKQVVTKRFTLLLTEIYHDCEFENELKCLFLFLSVFGMFHVCSSLPTCIVIVSNPRIKKLSVKAEFWLMFTDITCAYYLLQRNKT